MEEPNIINLGRLGIKFSLFLLQYKATIVHCSSDLGSLIYQWWWWFSPWWCSWNVKWVHAFIFHFSGNSCAPWKLLLSQSQHHLSGTKPKDLFFVLILLGGSAILDTLCLPFPLNTLTNVMTPYSASFTSKHIMLLVWLTFFPQPPNQCSLALY